MNKPMMDRVWPLEVEPSSLRVGLLFLAAEADERGRGATSMPALAEIVHRSEAAVRRHLAVLQGAGLIVVTARAGASFDYEVTV